VDPVDEGRETPELALVEPQRRSDGLAT
jgi:hypothetical protein